MEIVTTRSANDATSGQCGYGGLPWQVESTTQAVADMTESIFCNRPSIRVVYDPEYRNRTLVVSIHAAGTTEEIIRKSVLWHRSLNAVAGDDSPLYALSVFPADESE
jgi:hypothetical protein